MDIVNFTMTFTLKDGNRYYQRFEQENGVTWCELKNNGVKLVTEENCVILEKEFEKTLESYYD